MRRLTSAALFVLLTLAPAAAFAVTVDQIVSLTKSGISEPIILALIERDKTVFSIDPEQLVSLRRDGLSENVILAMLKSGREEGEAAANAAAALNSAVIMSSLSPAPDIVVIGHDPDRPSGYSNGYSNGYGNGYSSGYGNGYWTSPPMQDVSPYYAAPYYGLPTYGAARRGRRTPLNVRPIVPPLSSTPTGVCTTFPPTVGPPPMVGSRGFVGPCPPGVR
jgi:hypothetical protein